MEGQQSNTASLHTYLKSIDADLDNRVVSAINNAKTKIHAMPAPFVQNYTNAANGEAIAACQALDDILSEVNTLISKQ